MRLSLLALAFSVLFAAPVRREDPRINHLLSRATFGARPGDADAVKQLGWKKWLDLQLNPARIPENPQLESLLTPLESLRMSSAEMARVYPLPKIAAAGPAAPPTPLARRRFAQASPAERRDFLLQNTPVRVIAYDLAEAKVYRALYSNRQLQEVLTDFWFNHFNVFFDKGADRYLVTSYERDAIRPHVLGKFSELLRATAEHPAMLFYLDNWQSVAEGATPRQKRGLNENYARELMELHTLGVDAGYTQQDIVEVARCFTGWTIRNPRQGGEFYFAPRLHDRGEKTVLGVRIPACGGQDDALQVLDILARHPSTARFISRKLAVRFISDNPPAALVDRMAKTFQKTGGDIREVLRVLFESREFWAKDAYQAKIKSPLEFVVSAVRATEAEVDNGFALAEVVGRMGQPLYRKQEPTGYSNASADWVNSSGLLERMNFATTLAANKLPGVKLDPGRYGQSGVELGSPQFQRR
jgi:uncharacterized protein (DUF1800 family)